MWRLSAVVVVALAIWCACPVSAQSPSDLQPGDRIRLVTPGERGIFDVVAVPELVVRNRRTGEDFPVPLATVERLDVHRGSQSRGRSALRGTLIGGAVGAIGGGIIGYADADDSFFSREESTVIGAILFGGTGIVAGALVGALRPGSRWERLIPKP